MPAILRMSAITIVMMLAFAAPTTAAPEAEPWPLWERHDDTVRRQIDQSVWAQFLRTYVRPGDDGINRVAYSAVTQGDRSALETDLRRLQATEISTYARIEQRAFWTNLYNELTVLIILQHLPVTSITKINLGSGLFSRGPWDAKLLRIEGTALSLNDIEHRILRPIWRDPRTHYTVNCASLGCPNLALVPYAEATMEAMLDRGARDYVNSNRGAMVRDGRLTASRIYDWYEADFGGTEAGVLAHLRRYGGPELMQALIGITSVSSYTYDWALNAQ